MNSLSVSAYYLLFTPNQRLNDTISNVELLRLNLWRASILAGPGASSFINLHQLISLAKSTPTPTMATNDDYNQSEAAIVTILLNRIATTGKS